jgi:methylated-DNA-[protein]-cysteine S-methyltransferase
MTSTVASLDGPFGRIGVEETNGAITRVFWDAPARAPATPVLRAAVDQLRAYFDGGLTEFDLPLAPRGSDFQIAVCDLMRAIPYGETRTYGDLAKDLGVAAQPVGKACGGNPIPILIPCHRVMGADGKLVGFSAKGGVETKVALLRLEGAAGLLI